MEKCLQMTTPRASFLRNTRPRFASIHNHNTSSSSSSSSSSTNILKPSTITTSSFSSHIFNPRSLIVCSKYSVNEVEVVTGCSWTELVVAADMAVVVEFWAAECGPWRMVDEVAKEYGGKALCYKLNTDDYPNVASQYGIRSIPTMLFFKDGEEKERVIGVVPKSTLCATLDKYVD